MRPLFLLLAVAACSSAGKSSPAARWEIDQESNLAVPVCPACGGAVLRDETKCAACGAACHVEPATIDCPMCKDGEAVSSCEACQGSGKCAICDGSGQFEGAQCPECAAGKTCPDCQGEAQAAKHACGNCDGTGKISLE